MPIVKDRLVDDTDTPQPGVSVTITLVVAGPAYVGTDQIVTEKVAVTNVLGIWSANLVSNNLISPAGTHYSVISDLPGDTAQTFVVPNDNVEHNLVDLLT